ncbi:hypothetical protein F4780DRAFT_722590 [Xylariomycetidae sp. FL0641]|nr:hypothetical protein F4780DRAFT_722590 [Xylariomycetidae sp. FL0641]
MPPPSLSQTTLALALAASTTLSYLALRDPNPQRSAAAPSTGDSIRALNLTSGAFVHAFVSPLALLSLYTVLLVLTQPQPPAWLLRHGRANALAPSLLTWTPATALPLALVLVLGAPLRLASYAALGRDFSFSLAPPGDGLVTAGLYAWVQHPSYTGLLCVVLGNAALLARLDGALACLVPPRLHAALRSARPLLAPAALALFVGTLAMRVAEEERMLHAEFGKDWEDWHRSTARFVPWVF